MRFWRQRKRPDITTGALYGRRHGGEVEWPSGQLRNIWLMQTWRPASAQHFHEPGAPRRRIRDHASTRDRHTQYTLLCAARERLRVFDLRRDDPGELTALQQLPAFGLERAPERQAEQSQHQETEPRRAQSDQAEQSGHQRGAGRPRGQHGGERAAKGLLHRRARAASGPGHGGRPEVSVPSARAPRTAVTSHGTFLQAGS